MRTPRSRRALLTSVPLVAASLAGCFDSRFTSADDEQNSQVVDAEEYDCADLERPPADPDLPSDLTLEPADYPDPPADVVAEADQYAHAFEEAYRRNAFLEEYGTTAGSFDFRYLESRADGVDSDEDEDAALVAIVYDLVTETTRGDSLEDWAVRVVYYVDESVALRARYDGLHAGDSLPFIPDPRRDGTLVDCFE